MASEISHVVYATDAKMWPHLFVSLYSLLVNNPQRRWAATIISNAPHETFIARVPWLKARTSLAGVTVAPAGEIGAALDAAPVPAHLTSATYYRLSLANALPRSAARALYLDCDTIVARSIEPLLATGLRGMVLAAADNGGGGQRPRRLSLPDGATYFNTGVMLIDVDRWRASDTERRVLQYIADARGSLKWADQDALNVVLAKERLQIPRTYNWQTGGVGGLSAAIIHYAGAHKPWIDPAIPLPSVAYWRYRQRTPYALPAPGVMATAGGEVRRFLRRLVPA